MTYMFHDGDVGTIHLGSKRKLHNAEKKHEGESFRKGGDRIGKVRAEAWERADKRESRKGYSDED